MDPKQENFMALVDRSRGMLVRICSLYSSEGAEFDDLYQEVLANLWEGFDGLRGDSKPTTWLYRVAINTCLTWHRRHDRHRGARIDNVAEPVAEESDRIARYRTLQAIMTRLDPVDRALITLWLDGNSYDDIAIIAGISRSNTAVRLHRIREKMGKIAKSMEL